MNIPMYVKIALNAASGVSKCYVNNQNATEWLCDNLGLVTDNNEHNVNGHVVDFCWKLQKWFVKA